MIPQEQNELLKYLPGKTDRNDSGKWLPVWMHLEDTAQMMSLLIKNWIPDIIRRNISDIERLGIFIGLTHDIGKMTPVFADHIQKSLPENKLFLESLGLSTSSFSGNEPHAYMGMCILLKYNCPPGIAVTVGSHHGKPPSLSEYSDAEYDIDEHPEYYYDNNETIWEEIHREWFDYSLSKSGYSSVDELPQLDKPAEMLMTGLLIMADWLGSNTDYFPLTDWNLNNDPATLKRDYNEIWKTIGLPGPWTPCYPYMDKERFTEMFRFPPFAVQELLLKAVNESQNPGIYILEAPMGCGKTEAALAASERLDSKFDCGGLFFGLPTQATANGIFTRLVRWAEARTKETDITESIRLAHGMAELNEYYRNLFRNTDKDSLIEDDENANLIVHSWFNGRKQALLANFVIGTVDQMLMASLAKKHVMLRQLGLAGKVVILDECHAYDAYMNRFMDRTLQWLGSYGTPVIILSATLPSERRTELIKAYLDGRKPQSDQNWENSSEYPLLTWTDGDIVRQENADIEEDKKHPVFVRKLPNDGIIDCLKENLSDGGYAGIIVNTVRTSQMLNDELRKIFPDADIRLFHSQFLAPVRADKEEKLLRLLGREAPRKPGEKVIIIGTQVLEQSLDLDFDMMITELCPMDLLLQRIGRLHRHKDHDPDRPEKLKKAQCYVLPASEAAHKIYADWLLKTTEELLPEKISIPDDISKLVQKVYKEPDEKSDLWNNYKRTIEIQESNAQLMISECRKRRRPKDNTIVGLLNTEFTGDDQQAEMGVRDGGDSLEVIMLSLKEDNAYLISDADKGKSFSISSTLSDNDGRKIASQRIRLPYIFTVNNMINRAIAEITVRNRVEIQLWQDSKWVRGQLVLFLDENNAAVLCGKHLVYDNDTGLREV